MSSAFGRGIPWVSGFASGRTCTSLMKLRGPCMAIIATACATSSGVSTFEDLFCRGPRIPCNAPGTHRADANSVIAQILRHATRSPARPIWTHNRVPPPANVFFPARELMLMMSPDFRPIIEWHNGTGNQKDTLQIGVHQRGPNPASVFSCTAPNMPMPALFTRIEIGPRRISRLRTSDLTSADRADVRNLRVELLRRSLAIRRRSISMPAHPAADANGCAQTKPACWRSLCRCRGSCPSPALFSRTEPVSVGRNYLFEFIAAIGIPPRASHVSCATLILLLWRRALRMAISVLEGH